MPLLFLYPFTSWLLNSLISTVPGFLHSVESRILGLLKSDLNQADSEERPQAVTVWEHPKGQDLGQAILRAFSKINLY